MFCRRHYGGRHTTVSASFVVPTAHCAQPAPPPPSHFSSFGTVSYFILEAEDELRLAALVVMSKAVSTERF